MCTPVRPTEYNRIYWRAGQEGERERDRERERERGRGKEREGERERGACIFERNWCTCLAASALARPSGAGRG
eukprot:8028754-Heterocapsa_arctica.AAC.1